MVATTAGQKMPATHCGKAAARPAVDDTMLAVMDDAGRHGGREEGEGGHREEKVNRAAPDAKHGGKQADDDEERRAGYLARCRRSW